MSKRRPSMIRPMEAILLAQPIERGGELELAALAHVVVDVLLEVLEDLRLDDVLAEDGQVLVFGQAGDAQVVAGVVDGRLFGELGDVEQPVLFHPDAGRVPKLAIWLSGVRRRPTTLVPCCW